MADIPPFHDELLDASTVIGYPLRFLTYDILLRYAVFGCNSATTVFTHGGTV